MTHENNVQLGRAACPRRLNGTQAKRGQAALPNPELFYLRFFSESLWLIKTK